MNLHGKICGMSCDYNAHSILCVLLHPRLHETELEHVDYRSLLKHGKYIYVLDVFIPRLLYKY